MRLDSSLERKHKVKSRLYVIGTFLVGFLSCSHSSRLQLHFRIGESVLIGSEMSRKFKSAY